MPAGPAGPAVVNGLTRVPGPSVAILPGAQGSSTATCPAGQGIVHGGFLSTGAGSVSASDTFGSANAWTVNLDNIESLTSADVQAIAYCAPTGQAVGPRSRRTPNGPPPPRWRQARKSHSALISRMGGSRR